MENTQRRCPKCGEMKALSEFSPGNRRCKRCKSEQATARYWASAEYREERKAYHRQREREKRADPKKNAVILERLREKRATNAEWRQRTLDAVNARRHAFPGRHLVAAARRRARGRGVPCTITGDWAQGVLDGSPCCAYCGRHLRRATSKWTDESPTLDRVRPERGYTPENTVFACFRCNTLKRDASLAELEALAANIRRVLGECH